MVICSVLLVSSVQAAGGELRLFNEGNLLYQEKNYTEALEKYRQIEARGRVNAALYYNMANSYYRKGQIAQAVVYYERALRLSPGDEDVQANLSIANQATVDKISRPEEFVLLRWIERLLYLFPFSTVLRISIMVYYLLASSIIILILGRNERLRLFSRRMLLVAAGVFIVFLLLLSAQLLDSRNRIEAVILPPEVQVMSSPQADGVEVFLLHEGTKVRISQRTDDWLEIVLLDGKVGWVLNDVVEVI